LGLEFGVGLVSRVRVRSVRLGLRLILGLELGLSLWFGLGDVREGKCPALVTGSRTRDLLITSPTPNPLRHCEKEGSSSNPD